MNKNTNIIAKEGIKPIGCIFLIFLFFYVIDADFFSFFSFVVMVFSLYFFRNEEHIIPREENQILAPIDGTIKDIIKSDSGIKIVIVNSLMDNHLIRMPIDSEIEDIQIKNGAFLSFGSDKLQKLNQKAHIVLKGIKLTLISTFIPKKPKLYIKNWDKVQSGDRIGFLYSGIVIMQLPSNIKLSIQINDKIKSAESVIGREYAKR